MKINETPPKVRPIGTAFPHEKPEKGIDSDPIFRLIQNSRRIPPSSSVTRRDLSIFLSFAREFGKALVAWISRRRKKRNLYEELANTVNEIEEGSQKANEELSALENRIENRCKATTAIDDNEKSSS